MGLCIYRQQPLTYVLTSAKLDAYGQRRVAKLANYNLPLDIEQCRG